MKHLNNQIYKKVVTKTNAGKEEMNKTNVKTYQATVAQARASRAIAAHITEYLKDYKLTTMQWSILGLVHEAGKEGIRISDLAKLLDTSLAFVTNTINSLQAKNIVERAEHGSDNRAKLVKVTKEFEPKIARIERDLSKRMTTWLSPAVSKEDFETHLKVLNQIASLDK